MEPIGGSGKGVLGAVRRWSASIGGRSGWENTNGFSEPDHDLAHVTSAAQIGIGAFGFVEGKRPIDVGMQADARDVRIHCLEVPDAPHGDGVDADAALVA
jgi:hypothetical protein